jgi:hypothetical protein
MLSFVTLVLPSHTGTGFARILVCLGSKIVSVPDSFEEMEECGSVQLGGRLRLYYLRRRREECGTRCLNTWTEGLRLANLQLFCEVL